MSKIVIIEDNELVARIYERKLIKEGHLTGVALDGRRGLEMVRQINPDLVLIDLNLPEISGVDVIRKLRRDVSFAKLKIIAYSADSYLLNKVKDINPTKIISKKQASAQEILNQIENLLDANIDEKDVSSDEFIESFDDFLPDYMSESTELQKKILIVEDDEIVLNIVKTIVEKLGYPTVCVKDGREAYKILKDSSNFLAGIFDVEIPYLKGTELVKYMRNEKRLAKIPVIIMTGEKKNINVQLDSVTSGATLFLPKPFKRESLETLITILSKNF